MKSSFYVKESNTDTMALRNIVVISGKVKIAITCSGGTYTQKWISVLLVVL
jgi:hypothetical protein